MSRSPTLGEVISEAMEFRLDQLHTAMPAQVTAYDSAKQRVDVQPVLKRVSDDGSTKALPVIANIPVVFPRAGEFFMSFPVKPGDYVMLVFAERSLDKWLTQGGIVDPVITHMHQFMDAVAIPGVYPEVSKLPATDANSIVIGKQNLPAKESARKGDNVEITITPANITTMALSNGGGPVVAASPVTITGTITSGSANVKVTD